MTSAVQTSLSAATSAVQTVNSISPSSGNVNLKVANLTDANAASGATDGQVLSYDNGSSTWVPATVSSTTVSDATASTKGIIQLAGDLAPGTNGAANPTVPGLTTKVDKAGDTMTGKLTVPSLQVTTGTPASGQVLTSDSSGNASWTTPAAGTTLDSTVTDIQPDTVTGTAVVGSTGNIHS
jgi:hypothetical protein